VVVVQADDDRWRNLPCRHDLKIESVPGGAERSDSVYRGLLALQGRAADDDWILVHDAVRPCITNDAINSLLDSIHGQSAGGLLAFPVRETLKKVDEHHTVQGTLNRGELWAAQTPQVFRYKVLREALEYCREHQTVVTDESMAVEALGMKPKVVLGSVDNIKITWPEDLTLASLLLLVQGKGEG
jgi:2-C-methyl-D-erythritol 4-phosphate cytidylyltransferase